MTFHVIPRNPGVIATIRRSVARQEFFAGLAILACANGLLGRILLAANTEGLSGLLTADISVIILFACFAGATKLLEGPKDEITSRDFAVGCVVLLSIVLPIFTLSWLALA